VSGFDLAFRDSFALILFDLLGLVFCYQIQLVRFATAVLGTELAGQDGVGGNLIHTNYEAVLFFLLGKNTLKFFL
jgi:hypothetical protein